MKTNLLLISCFTLIGMTANARTPVDFNQMIQETQEIASELHKNMRQHMDFAKSDDLKRNPTPFQLTDSGEPESHVAPTRLVDQRVQTERNISERRRRAQVRAHQELAMEAEAFKN